MTASTPPLVDVIAGAIEAHTLCTSYRDGTGVATNTCTCGNEHLFKIEEPYDSDGEAFRQHAAHQARAVLAALTEAQAVAWDEGAAAAWERSTPTVNGAHYKWRHEGEPLNPYRNAIQQALDG